MQSACARAHQRGIHPRPEWRSRSTARSERSSLSSALWTCRSGTRGSGYRRSRRRVCFGIGRTGITSRCSSAPDVPSMSCTRRWLRRPYWKWRRNGRMVRRLRAADVEPLAVIYAGERSDALLDCRRRQVLPQVARPGTDRAGHRPRVGSVVGQRAGPVVNRYARRHPMATLPPNTCYWKSVTGDGACQPCSTSSMAHRRERLRVDACTNPGTDAIPALCDDTGDSRQAPRWSTSYVLNSDRPHINRTRRPTIAKLPNPQVLLLSVAERADSRLLDQSLLTTSAA